MRLSLQLAAAMAVAALLPLIVTGYFAMQIAIDADTAKSNDILLRDAVSVATYIDTWTLAQRDGLRGWTVPFKVGDNPALQTGLLRAIILAMPAVVNVVLVDPEAQLVVDPMFDDARGSADRAFATVQRLPISAALESRADFEQRGLAFALGGAIGQPWLPEGATVPSVPIAIAGPNDPNLVLGAEISLDEIQRLVDDETSADHAVEVTTGDGSPIVGGGTALVDPALLQPILDSGADSNVTYRLSDGTEVRGAIATVPSTGWRVIVVEPAARVEATAHEIRVRTGQVLAVSMLLSLALGAVLARSLIQPVLELRDGALKVAEGELLLHVTEDREDELGDLQRAFNHMSRRLKTNRTEIDRQRGEIEAFNRELHERVDQRTRELREAQQRLVQSGQLAAVAEMGAGLAHELNNPLAAILGLTQVLRARLRGTPDDDRLARVEEQAARCRDVVASMLKLSEGQLDPGGTGVIELRSVLTEVTALVAGPFRQRGVNLVVDPAGEPLPIRADPVAMSRILAQILHSFRAGLGDGARLAISGAIEGDHAVIRFAPDRPIATGDARDDWMASGMGLWVARRQLDGIDGRLDEPTASQSAWLLSVPVAA